MIKRSTWVMVVILAILAGLVYYMQQPDNLIKKAFTAKQTATTEPPGQLLAETDKPVNGVSVSAPDGRSAAIVRQSSGWTLTVGAESPTSADQNAADQIASQAESLRIS